MTGPEFALNVIGSMIAAVIYDMLRNPFPPAFRTTPIISTQDSKKYLNKFFSRLLPFKKEEPARPTPEALPTTNSTLDLIRLKLTERYKNQPANEHAGSYRKSTKISPSYDSDIVVFQPFLGVTYPKKT